MERRADRFSRRLRCASPYRLFVGSFALCQYGTNCKVSVKTKSKTMNVPSSCSCTVGWGPRRCMPIARVVLGWAHANACQLFVDCRVWSMKLHARSIFAGIFGIERHRHVQPTILHKSDGDHCEANRQMKQATMAGCRVVPAVLFACFVTSAQISMQRPRYTSIREKLLHLYSVAGGT